MTIFIDESGRFLPDAKLGRRFSAVAAIVVRDSVKNALLDEFGALRASWSDAPEVKGSSLSDEQIITALSLLRRYDVVAEIASFDAAHNPERDLTAFMKGQAEGFVAALTPSHSAAAHNFAHRLRTEWLKMPLQLQTQLYALVLTAEEVIHQIPTYVAQRWPEELAAFHWVIDRKDVTITPYERLWQDVVAPLLQMMSLARPGVNVIGEGFDYSYMDRFRGEIPAYLLPHAPTPPAGAGLDIRRATDVGLIMRESVAFEDSRANNGLQLADVVASTYTKAMNGKLAPAAWRLLGPLTIEAPRRQLTVRVVAFGDGHGVVVSTDSYEGYVLRAIRNRAQKMFAPNWTREGA